MTTVTVSPPSNMRWSKVSIPYSQLQAASFTNNVLALTLPVKSIVHRALLNVTQSFSGTATLSLSLGIASDNTKYVPSLSALATGVLNGASITSPSPESMSATTNINLYAAATLQNLSSLTQGSVDIYVLISQLP